MEVFEKYKNQIASVLNASSNQVFLYWKGRVALYAILKSIGVKKGDEVILQAFTCVVVANAIKYLGATPVYVDINHPTLNTDLDKIKQKVNDKTKAVICQNTFGLSSQVEEIASFCSERNIFSIEDCTHGFGGKYNNKPNGTICDAAFYSTQWNKPYSTVIGGFAFSNHPEILSGLNNLENQKLIPGTKSVISIQLQYYIKQLFLRDWNYWLLVRLYRFLSKNNILTGSSQGEEITGITEPTDFFMDCSNFQAKLGLKNLLKLESVNKQRKSNAIKLNQFLKTHNKYFLEDGLLRNHSFLKFPVFVKDRDMFFDIAEKNKIQLGDWFNSPLHPVQEDFEKWDLDLKNTPLALKLSKQIVNIQTEGNHLEKTLSFLNENLDQLL